MRTSSSTGRGMLQLAHHIAKPELQEQLYLAALGQLTIAERPNAGLADVVHIEALCLDWCNNGVLSTAHTSHCSPAGRLQRNALPSFLYVEGTCPPIGPHLAEDECNAAHKIPAQGVASVDAKSADWIDLDTSRSSALIAIWKGQ